MKYKLIPITIILILILAYCNLAHSQDERKGLSFNMEEFSSTITDSFKKAIQEADEEKSAQKEQEEQRISLELDNFINKWIDERKAQRSSELNGLIDQDARGIFVKPPQAFNYYLRDFSYSLIDKNIEESNSISYPYKATLVINEALYMEQAPLIADPRSDHQYTGAIDKEIKLQYDKDISQWQVASIENSKVSLAKGWPQNIKSKLSTYFIPSK